MDGQLQLAYDYPFVSSMLESIARSYEREGEWHDSECLASIICYSSHVLVGYVNFYNAGQVPQSTIRTLSPPQHVLTINYSVELVEEVLNTLRLEKAVHIGVDLSQRAGWVGMTDTAAVGHISTELVGDSQLGRPG